MSDPFDPLAFFPSEKVAKIMVDPDPESDDPGERALAGIAAAGGGLASAGIPLIGNLVLGSMADADAIDWPQTGFGRGDVVKRLREFDEPAGPRPSARVLGALPVTERLRNKDVELSPRQLRELDDIDVPKLNNIIEQSRKTVDSFIDKHNLPGKGVTMSFRGGPMAGGGGPRYNIGSKVVTMPRVNKEIMLHELGHAADYTSGRVGRARGLLEAPIRRGAQIALPIAYAAGDEIADILPGTIDDKAIKFMQDHGPEIMGATLAATQLYPEAKASTLAIRHIAETEGRDAAVRATKRLAPAFGTYLLGAIPAVAGMSLARKYMREARDEKEGIGERRQSVLDDLEKQGSILRSMKSGFMDIGHVGREIGRGAKDIIVNPGRARRIAQAAKETGTSPEFVHGALTAALPSAMGALYLYGTDSGRAIRGKMDKEDVEYAAGIGPGKTLGASKASDAWREENPARFAGLVGLGAALSGGVMAKFLSDLSRVL